jgi:hypothetical protein
VLTNALCALIFAVAYPETRGKLSLELKRKTIMTNAYHAGKSLEEIDEIFGDVQTVPRDDIRIVRNEKGILETVEIRDDKTGHGSV